MKNNGNPMQSAHATMHCALKALWFSMQKSRRSQLDRLPPARRWRWRAAWQGASQLQAWDANEGGGADEAFGFAA